jgi:hypothetical protein|tara:strand:+ start:606 stop:899 length:294 start_codon:yes stop_codon:yes gene_type:complete
MPKDWSKESQVHGTIAAALSPGYELDVMTSQGYGQVVLNLRMRRTVPGVTGHVGYTRQGFIITREEAIILRDLLQDIIPHDSNWEVDDGNNMVEVDE